MKTLAYRAWGALALGGLFAAGAAAAPPANPAPTAPKAAPAAAPAAPTAKPVAPTTGVPANASAAAATVPARRGDHHFRTSTIESMKVRNSAGEDLGKIKDLVIDIDRGTVDYAALDFGGFLGIGDKLFAVPWSAFQVSGSGRDRHLVLDVPKDRLKTAPGFDKNHWPDMADPKWSHDVDIFYGHPKTAATR